VVRVSSEPAGATVVFDGRLLDRVTPCELPAVPQGDYPLWLTMTGFRPHQATLSIPATGEVVLPIVRLVPDLPTPAAAPEPPSARSELTVRSSPASLLYVEDRLVGRTPRTLQVDRGRPVELRLEHPNYQTLRRTVRGGEEALLELHLFEKGQKAPPREKAELGTVRFQVSPWATVSCGEFHFGSTPFSDKQLPPGTYECVFTNPEFGTRTARVLVKPNGLEKVTVKF
jgi:hypothetical protein